MPLAVGGNLLFAAGVSYSPTPSASYPAGKVYYLDESLSDWDTGSATVAVATPHDIEAFYTDYTAWNISEDATAEVTFDIGEARGGDLFLAQGFFGTSSITRPKAIKLEHSDNGSSWTTVDDLTGLSAGGTGAQGWLYVGDISAEGDHQYWRLTLTCGGVWLFLSTVVIQ